MARDTRGLGTRVLARPEWDFSFDGAAPIVGEATLTRLVAGGDPRSQFAGEPRGELTSYSLTPSSTTVTEGNTSITFTITRSGDKPAQTIYASTLFDTARSPGDYDGLVNLAVTFSLNQTSKTFTVSINEDSLVEATEHFRVMIGDDTSDGSAQALDISDVFITDDDAPTGTTYSLTPSSTTVVEGNTSITFTITRSGNISSSATIYASTLFDTASSPGDYDGLVNRVVSFAANDATETFTVSINEDSLVEATEHFRVMIGDDTSDGSAQALDISDVFITDDDAPTGTTYSLTPSSTTVVEGNTSITFTITRSGNTSSSATIYASTLFDTASSPGDYDGLVNHVVSFAANDPTETFTVSINEDSLVEATEHFRVMIGDDTSDQSAQALDISDVFITDNDGGTPGTTFTITPASTSVVEGSQLVFTITRSSSQLDQTVYFSTWQDTATFDENDYSLVGGGEPLDVAIHFVAGDPTETITLSILQDGHPDAGERFRAIVQGNPPASDPAINLAQTGYITINEGPPQNTDYELSPSSISITEGGQLVFTVTRTGDKPPETIYFSTLLDGTANFNEGDYATALGGRPLNIPVIFGAGVSTQIVTLNIFDDGTPDSGEQFRAIIQRIGNNEPVSSYLDRSSYVTIKDPTYTEDEGEVGEEGPFSVLAHIVPIAHAGELPRLDHGFRYPVGIGSVPTLDSDGDGFYSYRVFQRPDIDNEDITGNRHTGIDINGESGGNSDDGTQVFSAFGGVVSFVSPEAGMPNSKPGWGGIVMITHTLGDGSRYTTVYGHLEHIPSNIVEHQWIASGTLLGDFDDIDAEPNSSNPGGGAGFDGSVNDDFFAHLHFEIREGHQGEAQLGAGYATTATANRGTNQYGIRYADISLGGETVRFLDPISFFQTDRADRISGSDEVIDALIGTLPDDASLFTEVMAWGHDVLIMADRSIRYIVDRFEEITVIGANAIDRFIISPLFDTSILHNTVHFDGGAGNDVLIGSHADRRIVAEGGIGDDSLSGGLGDDIFDGGDGNDLLNGGLGADTLMGGAGDDLFEVDNAGDRTIEAADEGYDIVHASTNFVLEAGSHVEVLWAAASGLTLTGNELGNVFWGTGGADIFNGGGGNDYLDGDAGGDGMSGGAGNDIFWVDSTSDSVNEATGEGQDIVYARVSYGLTQGSEIEVLAAGSAGALNLTGNDLANTIYGNEAANTLLGAGGNDVLASFGGNDYLDGGTGGDGMSGGAGNDIYWVDSFGDSVNEAAGEGQDIVYARASYALTQASEIEVLTAGIGAAIDLTGNDLANSLYGNEASNVLLGAGGNDVLASFGGNDYLDGGTGGDGMSGGAGDDIYWVDSSSDSVNEATGGGQDTVFARSSYALTQGSAVEVLAAGTGAAIDLTGNDLANAIYGNEAVNSLLGAGGNDVLAAFGGNDYLDGGTGGDGMSGGAGNDIYWVDSTSDSVNEAAGQGQDTVYARASYALTQGSEVEVLAAGVGTAIDLTGNDLANQVYGNEAANALLGAGGNDVLAGFGGNDYLDGGIGADAMSGGAGDDVYWVDAAGDTVTEATGEGQDTVYARSSYTLTAGAVVEVLAAGAAGALNLTGNTLANAIYGNNDANVLNGGAGNDVLGGFGGADAYAFTTTLGAGNVDRVLGFQTALDKIALDDAVFVGLTPGALAPGAFVIGGAAADADDRIIYNSATGVLLFDADGSGAGVAVQFAILDAAPTLAAADFLVI